MLIRTHMQDLKDVTRETHYENYRAHCIQSMTRMVVKERNRKYASAAAQARLGCTLLILSWTCRLQQANQGERYRLPHPGAVRSGGRHGKAHPRKRRGGTARRAPAWTRPRRRAWTWGLLLRERRRIPLSSLPLRGQTAPAPARFLKLTMSSITKRGIKSNRKRSQSHTSALLPVSLSKYLARKLLEFLFFSPNKSPPHPHPSIYLLY